MLYGLSMANKTNEINRCVINKEQIDFLINNGYVYSKDKDTVLVYYP